MMFVTASYALSQTAGTGSQQQMFERGERALAEGRYAEAEAAYEQLRQLSPGVAEVHGRLGLVFFQRKKFFLWLQKSQQVGSPRKRNF